MKLSADCTSVQLDIHENLDANQLDTLLRQLALLRADMTPSVPLSRESLAEANSNVLIEDLPGLTIAARQDGGFRLWMRHRGYGWLAYQIDNRTAVGINDYLTPRVRPEIDLVSDSSSHRH